MTTYWHQHPETVDRLAAEYALGTLAAPARRRMEALMTQRRDIAQAVGSWHERLGGVLAAQPPLPVDPGAWHRLESRLFGEPRKATQTSAWWSRWLSQVVRRAAPRTTAPPRGAWRSQGWGRSVIPAGTLAIGLLLGSVLGPLWEASRSTTQLPESYVGVLANADGKPGLIVSSLRKGLTVDLKQLSPVEVPEGKTLYLWTIDKDGQVHAVAAIPGGAFVSAPLSQPAEEAFFPAVELAVSIETAGAAPPQPTGPFVYRGLCGKLWKLPAN